MLCLLRYNSLAFGWCGQRSIHLWHANLALVQYTILSENTQDPLQPQQAKTAEALLLMRVACQVFVAI